MKLKVVWIGKTKEPAIQALTDDYVKRLSHYADVEAVAVRDEAALLKFCARDASYKTYSGPAGRRRKAVFFRGVG